MFLRLHHTFCIWYQAYIYIHISNCLCRTLPHLKLHLNRSHNNITSPSQRVAFERRLVKQLLKKWAAWINFNQSNEVPFYYPSLQIVPISSSPNTPVLRTSLIPHEKIIRSKSQVSWDPKEPWLQSILNTKQTFFFGMLLQSVMIFGILRLDLPSTLLLKVQCHVWSRGFEIVPRHWCSVLLGDANGCLDV